MNSSYRVEGDLVMSSDMADSLDDIDSNQELNSPTVVLPPVMLSPPGDMKSHTPTDWQHADFPGVDSTRAPVWPEPYEKATVSIKGTVMKGLMGVTMYEVKLQNGSEVWARSARIVIHDIDCCLGAQV